MSDTMPPEYTREVELVEPRSALEIKLDRIRSAWPRIRIDWVRWWVVLSVIYLIGLFADLV